MRIKMQKKRTRKHKDKFRSVANNLASAEIENPDWRFCSDDERRRSDYLHRNCGERIGRMIAQGAAMIQPYEIDEDYK